jgi:hypothetical protein
MRKGAHMTWHMMAMGAALVFAFGSGCTTQPDLTSVSALVRTDEPRTHVSPYKVTVDLGQIVTP